MVSSSWKVTWKRDLPQKCEVPAVVLDRGYDIVASVRYRLFARPTEACPLLPEHLRARFEP